MTRLLKRFLSLSLILTCALLAPAFSDGGKVKEAETELSFDAEIDASTKGKKLTCIGTGCREKYWVNVYAIAQWVDGEALKAELKKWAGKKGSQLADDQAFFDALASADVEKRLQMVYVTNRATADKVRETFGEGLKRTYKTFPPYVQRFLDNFKKDHKEKDTVEFRSLPGGTLELYLNGKKADAWPRDKEFAAAVWKIWLHKDVESALESVKKGLISRVGEIW